VLTVWVSGETETPQKQRKFIWTACPAAMQYNQHDQKIHKKMPCSVDEQDLGNIAYKCCRIDTLKPLKKRLKAHKILREKRGSGEAGPKYTNSVVLSN
jgi:hypothetical protein